MSYASFAEELRKWWSFDDRQMHTHSWHSREDFIKDKMRELIDRETKPLASEIERLRAALKPFADEVDMLGIQGCAPPSERMLMFASDGAGTFLGINMGAIYKAHAAYQLKD